MTEGNFSLISLYGLTVGLGMLTFLVITTTSFVKLAVVLALVRNALGVEQTPPNIVIYTVAVVLTVFISAPIFTEIAENLTGDDLRMETVEEAAAVFEQIREPIQSFLDKFTKEDQREFFFSAATRVWDERAPDWNSGHIIFTIPAFMTSELTRAFQIGFLLYLPFVTIDLVVTTLLMAMGMQVVPPTIISTPFKLFLFVSVDGWTRLVHGLVLSYA